MLVTNFKQAARVKKQFERAWAEKGVAYFAFDTETEPRPGLKDKKAALIYGRMTTRIWSICYRGIPYSFPTAAIGNEYPLIEEWVSFFKDWFSTKDITVVAHNWIYDSKVLESDWGIPLPPKIWDTMIGCWKTSEYFPKSLKERAPAYGRFLRETSTVDFGNLKELAEYAEQDVVQTDEIYQMHMHGKVQRSPSVQVIKPNCEVGILSTRLPSGRIIVERDKMTEFDVAWMKLVELPILRTTVRACKTGIPFDTKKLGKARIQMLGELRAALKVLYRGAGKVINPKSKKDLVETFERLGIENEFKTDKGAMAFRAPELKTIQDRHPFIKAMLAYAAHEKLQNTYIGKRAPIKKFDKGSGLEYYVNPKTGAIHPSINTVGAVTGRSSSDGPNLQNIPSRKDTFGLKSCFVANNVIVRNGRKRKMLVLDYAQLEIRIMALYCKDVAMTRILSDPEGDMHTATAQAFGVVRDPVAKQLNFLLLYGGRAWMLSKKLTEEGIPTTQASAQGYIDRQKQVYPRISEFRLELVAFLRANGWVRYFTGRKRFMPDINWNSPRDVHSAETTSSNNVVQGAGQDMLKAALVRMDPKCVNPDKAMLRIHPDLKKLHRAYISDKAREVEKHRRRFKQADLKYHVQVHDEIVASCLADEDPNDVLDRLAEIMSWRHYFPSISDYNVPLVAEGGVAETWKDAKSKTPEYHVKAGYDDFNKHR